MLDSNSFRNKILMLFKSLFKIVPVCLLVIIFMFFVTIFNTKNYKQFDIIYFKHLHELRERRNFNVTPKSGNDTKSLEDSSSIVINSDITLKLSDCKCQRRLTLSVSGKVNFSETTCSYDSFLRGNDQKVIAFTFFSDPNSEKPKSKKYFQGISANADLLKEFYPGWKIRLYHDAARGSGHHRKLCKITCGNENVDLCYVGKLPGNPLVDAANIYPTLWRFFPTLDPQVSLYQSRDLDSRFTDRKSSAVKEWSESGKSLHVMRDHPYHGIPILAGAWGARLTAENRGKWEHVMGQLLHDSQAQRGKEEEGQDQTLLKRYVWPAFNSSLVQHDSYSCKRYPGAVGFPTQRKKQPKNFVGAWGNKFVLWKTCPSACRRNPLWEQC